MKLVGSLVLLAALAGAPVVYAQTYQDENLIFSLPEGFQSVATANQDGREVTEYVPTGENAEAWTRMITVQTLREPSLWQEPSPFGESLGALWQQACPGVKSAQVRSDFENKIPVAVWTYICPRNAETGQPETMWMKALLGADAFYIVQDSYRKMVSKHMLDSATSFLDTVRVCDTRVPERPCPSAQ